MKKCSRCKQEKELENFPRSRKRPDGRHVYCKTCHSIKAKEWRRNNPSKWECLKERNFAKWRLKIGKPLEEVGRKKRSGQGYISKWGYLSFKKIGHPCADKHGRVQASHLVVYENTGRIITKGQTVHHINGDTLDNRFENLEVWDSFHPSGQREQDKIKWCIEYLGDRGYRIEKDQNGFPRPDTTVQ